jgi:hypothetical protein
MSSQTIFNGMNWILVAIALALFATWIVLRVVLAIPLGILNILWMFAFLFVVLWGVQGLES